MLVAILLVALNLRGPLVALAPVLDEIKTALGLTSVTAGLLTSLPVLCFALATPFVSRLIGRVGPERAVFFTLAGVLIGTLIRSTGTSAAALLGTAVLGVSITIGNIVVPVLIHRDIRPERRGFATGLYTSALNVGAMLTSLITAPLAALWGWQWALVAWGVLALLAAAVWQITVVRILRPAAVRLAESAADQVVSDAAAEVSQGSPARSLTAWLLTLAFGGQAFAYYGSTAWMPSLLADELGQTPTHAGASASIFQIVAVVGALGVPALAKVMRPRWIALILMVLWLSLPFGMILAPELWVLWICTSGAAQGGGITVVFMIVIQQARSGTYARRLSAQVQGGGYVLAAVGPTVVGALHDATGGWVGPMLAVAIAAAVFGISCLISATRADHR